MSGNRANVVAHAALSGAKHGAAVWVVYGLIETGLVVASPLLKKMSIHVAPWVFASTKNTYVPSVRLTAGALLSYALAGGLSGVLAALVLSTAKTGHRFLPKSDAGSFWSAVGTLTLLLVFAVNAICIGQTSIVAAAVVPTLLATLRLIRSSDADRRETVSTHPIVIVLLLMTVCVIIQERPYVTSLVRISLAVGFTVGALLLLACLEQRLRAAAGFRRISCWSAPWGTLLLLSVAAVAMSRVAKPPSDAGLTAVGPRTADRLPNIVLITLDTVRADHLSLYGYSRDTTPNLRQFARTATLFRRAVASSNWTLPTHASIFLGVSPRIHGVHDTSTGDVSPRALPRNRATLAELLSRRGYRTGAVVANNVILMPECGFNRGFSSFECMLPDDFEAETGRPYLLRTALRNAFAGGRREAVYCDAAAINDRAEVFLRSATENGQPFFLFLNYMDAHVPYVPPVPFDRRYDGKDSSFRWVRLSQIHEEVTVQRVRPLRQSEFAHLTSQYDGAIAYLDDQVGRLFETLRDAGVYDNTLIIITADHGEAFGESCMLGHGTSLYQHQIHVPLLIKFPHSVHCGRADAVVSSVDILPTILDVVGVPIPAGAEGRSLLRSPEESRWVTSESYRSRGPGFTSNDARPAELAIFFGSLKRIVGAGGGYELYDVATDPNEAVNLKGQRPLPRDWDLREAEYMNQARHQRLVLPIADPELLNRFRALGYLR